MKKDGPIWVSIDWWTTGCPVSYFKGKSVTSACPKQRHTDSGDRGGKEGKKKGVGK